VPYLATKHDCCDLCFESLYAFSVIKVLNGWLLIAYTLKSNRRAANVSMRFPLESGYRLSLVECARLYREFTYSLSSIMAL
jgi:hypothetical protein